MSFRASATRGQLLPRFRALASLPEVLVWAWVAVLPVFSAPQAPPPLQVANRDLRLLAARAAQKNVWSSLRRYAATAKDGETRGLAFFTLGYREYEAGLYRSAAADLGLAEATGFSLADFTAYYQGAAAQAEQAPREVIDALAGFNPRYPESELRYAALDLLSQALLQTNQPERAIQTLMAEPRVHQRPALGLLLARAYWQSQRLPEAAQAFQDVYYNFPVASESRVAAAALDQLKARLGLSFPPLTEETETARAEGLFKASRFADALKEYDALLEARPASPPAERWRTGRAQCLLRLRRAHEVVDDLSGGGFSQPETDAERLSLLVDAYAHLDDQAAMLLVLDSLGTVHPQSPWYASALLSAGSFFSRQGRWDNAIRYYLLLTEGFRQTDAGREGDWRLGWSYYLLGQSDKAHEALADHVTRYPNSRHVPAALYWLGRLAEESGQIAEARGYYSLIERRFVHSYYALEAGRRTRELPEDPANGGSSLVQRIPPPPPPPLQLCAPGSPPELVRPFRTLESLSLEDLAEHYLKNVLSDHPSALDVLYELSRFEAKRGNNSAALFDAKRLVPDYSEYEFSLLPEELWDMLYPRTFWGLVKKQALAHSLDPYVVMGVIRQESAFDPRATSRADARGLMQMLPQTAQAGMRGRHRRQMAVRKLYDPDYNIRVSCRYLRGLVRAFNGNLEEALAAYNAGDFRVKDWLRQRSFREPAEFLETMPFGETRVYVESVLRDAVIYRQLMTGSAKFKKCS